MDIDRGIVSTFTFLFFLMFPVSAYLLAAKISRVLETRFKVRKWPRRLVTGLSFVVGFVGLVVLATFIEHRFLR